MNKNCLEFDVVSVDQNNLQSYVVFEINQVSAVVRKTNVGQFVNSCPFELNFPTSIGKSKWVVILFLNGQYEAGQSNEQICIYLKLVDCEHQSVDFKFDVKFQLGTERATITKKDQKLCFDNAKTRWMGAKLMFIRDMIKNNSRFIQDDMLFLSVHLSEHLTKHVSSTETSYLNQFLIDTGPYVKSEPMDTDFLDPYPKPVSSTESSHSNTSNNNNRHQIKKEPCFKVEKMDTDFPELSTRAYQKYSHQSKAAPAVYHSNGTLNVNISLL